MQLLTLSLIRTVVVSNALPEGKHVSVTLSSLLAPGLDLAKLALRKQRSCRFLATIQFELLLLRQDRAALV